MSLCELADLLDPRPCSEAASCPILKACNIPLTELPKRMHELPAKGNVVSVCDLGVLAGDTVMLLEDRGYECAIVSFAYENGFSEFDGEPEPEVVDGVVWRSTPKKPRFRLWAPNTFLMSVAEGLPPGKAVDLGCGSGRDTVALADLGWQVEAVDILPDAVEKGKDLLKRYAPQAVSSVKWRACDIGAYVAKMRSFNLIVSNLFFDPVVLRLAADLLAPGGILVSETFTETHREKHGTPHEKRVLSRQAFEDYPIFQIEHWSEDWSGDRHLAQVIARKG